MALTLVLVAGFGVLGGGRYASAVVTHPKHPSRAVQAFWARVARCETGGDWQMRGTTYSGGVGFFNQTWSWWAGELGFAGRYPNAGMAPRLVQVEVADYGLRVHRGRWGTIVNGCAGRYP